MTEITCANCRKPYPAEGAPYRCPVCHGVYDIRITNFDPGEVEPDQPGIWRYRHTFALPEGAPAVSLGEGNTPLEWREALGREIAFKLEYENPTGSYKDRGSAALAGFLLARSLRSVVEDSSGNAGASFAAYAAEAGLDARIFVPDSTSRPKRRQIEAYGAEIVRIMGPRSNAAEAVLRAVDAGAVYASHAYLPFGLLGYATIAYEIQEQLGQAPGALVIPAGHGNLLLAAGRGFAALQQAGLVEKLPMLVGVQAFACAPLWAVSRYGATGMGWVSEGETLAEGVRVKHPARGDLVLQTVMGHGGFFTAVDDERILEGRDQLAQLGFNVEPTSAIVWDALEQAIGQLPDPIVVVLTGAGFKSP